MMEDAVGGAEGSSDALDGGGIVNDSGTLGPRDIERGLCSSLPSAKEDVGRFIAVEGGGTRREGVCGRDKVAGGGGGGN